MMEIYIGNSNSIVTIVLCVVALLAHGFTLYVLSKIPDENKSFVDLINKIKQMMDGIMTILIGVINSCIFGKPPTFTGRPRKITFVYIAYLFTLSYHNVKLMFMIGSTLSQIILFRQRHLRMLIGIPFLVLGLIAAATFGRYPKNAHHFEVALKQSFLFFMGCLILSSLALVISIAVHRRQVQTNTKMVFGWNLETLFSYTPLGVLFIREFITSKPTMTFALSFISMDFYIVITSFSDFLVSYFCNDNFKRSVRQLFKRTRDNELLIEAEPEEENLVFPNLDEMKLEDDPGQENTLLGRDTAYPQQEFA
ncbi:hypothetical protein Ciccas_005396 [Cichlidogyrus casuarinus]|uniref:Vomeronasal type-1 receptor n=1 Tax=Cichlidogyrus casuarinus TaxID=1844966 RepID=A0ABD2Q8S7_9PLAT